MKSDLSGSIDTNRLVIRGAAEPPLKQPQQQQRPKPVAAAAAAATADEVAALAPGVVGAVTFFLVLFALMAAYWRCSRSSWQRRLQATDKGRRRQGMRGEAAADAKDVGGAGCNITVNPLMVEKGGLSQAVGGRDFRVELELQCLERLAEPGCECGGSGCEDDEDDDDDTSDGSGSSSGASSDADCDECQRRDLLARRHSGNYGGCGRLAQLASSEDELQEDDDCDFDDNGQEGPAPVESAPLIAA